VTLVCIYIRCCIIDVCVFAVCAVPFWAAICIAAAAALILLCCLICICRYCCYRRRKSKDAKKGLKGVVDLKSVQMLGNAYKEKVCLLALIHYHCFNISPEVASAYIMV